MWDRDNNLFHITLLSNRRLSSLSSHSRQLHQNAPVEPIEYDSMLLMRVVVRISHLVRNHLQVLVPTAPLARVQRHDDHGDCATAPFMIHHHHLSPAREKREQFTELLPATLQANFKGKTP